MTESFALPELAAALHRFGIELPEDRLEPLAAYGRLLWEWNERLNLTRHTTYDLFVGRDVYDSHQLAQVLKEDERIVDLGSGGGVPGMLIKILRPDVRVELCECIGKKARVLEQMRDALQLELPVHACRIEQVLPKSRRPYDAVVARGVGSLAKMLRVLAPHWPHFRRLLVIKGPKWVEERGEARHVGLLKELQLRKLVSYQPPGSSWESVILQIWPRD